MPEVPRFEARPEENLLLIMGGGKDLIRSWYRGSLEMEGRLAAFGPLFTGDPSVQFCLQAARRNLGDFETAHQWYSQFAARQPDGPWRSAALAELWLARRSGPPPKPVLSCRPADARPFLDGKLDDACWQGGPAVRLRNAAGKAAEECPTEVRLAYDRDYLYLAVRCARPADRRVEPAKVRGRDGDLRGQDRVSLVLDLDRDYATCYHLQIDQRGFVSEDCWGDKSWDPRWFVAVRSEAEAWVAEAAIPMTALTGDGITPGRAWAVNVVRALPGRGVQAFALPAEVPEVSLRPEGMGLLLFTQAPNQQAAAGLMPPSR